MARRKKTRSKATKRKVKQHCVKVWQVKTKSGVKNFKSKTAAKKAAGKKKKRKSR